MVVWIVLNAAAFSLRWDPYPFILLNLAFSTQAAYAAPLILLAQTRQAERDKLRDAAIQTHHDGEIRERKPSRNASRRCFTASARWWSSTSRCSPRTRT